MRTCCLFCERQREKNKLAKGKTEWERDEKYIKSLMLSNSADQKTRAFHGIKAANERTKIIRQRCTWFRRVEFRLDLTDTRRYAWRDATQFISLPDIVSKFEGRSSLSEGCVWKEINPKQTRKNTLSFRFKGCAELAYSHASGELIIWEVLLYPSFCWHLYGLRTGLFTLILYFSRRCIRMKWKRWHAKYVCIIPSIWALCQQHNAGAE